MQGDKQKSMGVPPLSLLIGKKIDFFVTVLSRLTLRRFFLVYWPNQYLLILFGDSATIRTC